jgi:hypothetical protein
VLAVQLEGLLLCSQGPATAPCGHFLSEFAAKSLCTFFTFHALYMPRPSRLLIILTIWVCIRTLQIA